MRNRRQPVPSSRNRQKSLMTNIEQALHILRNWWDALPTYRQNNNLPAQGALAGALVILDRLQHSYSLALESHTADGGVQIAGLGRHKTTQILARFGKKPLFLKECGRTNMGITNQMRALLNQLASLNLHALSQAERNAILIEMQRWLVVEKVSAYFNRERVKFDFAPEQTAWQTSTISSSRPSWWGRKARSHSIWWAPSWRCGFPMWKCATICIAPQTLNRVSLGTLSLAPPCFT